MDGLKVPDPLTGGRVERRGGARQQVLAFPGAAVDEVARLRAGLFDLAAMPELSSRIDVELEA